MLLPTIFEQFPGRILLFMRAGPTACGTCDLTNLDTILTIHTNLNTILTKSDTIHTNPDTIRDKFGSGEEEKAGIIISSTAVPFRDVSDAFVLSEM